MTLTLSHGPWSIAIAKPVDSRPDFRIHYTFTEGKEMNTTYCWDWKGQTLNSVSNCTFSFAKLGLHRSITWSTPRDQNAWCNAAPASNNANVGYVQIELNARYCWGSDLNAGQSTQNWHGLIKASGFDTVSEGNCSV